MSNLKAPTVAIAELAASDFKAIARQDRALHTVVMTWLSQLSAHKTTPATARREYGVVQIFSLEALNQPPWWRCLIVKQNPATGQPIRDPEDPTGYKSMYFTPGISPPRALVEAIDEINGKKLSSRIDGGPTPTNPAGKAGSGYQLPPKTPLRR